MKADQFMTGNDWISSEERGLSIRKVPGVGVEQVRVAKSGVISLKIGLQKRERSGQVRVSLGISGL
jgi:hypothetical protein